jgi:hypothetical protein
MKAVRVTKSLPHGHVSAVLAMARKLDLERLIDRTPSDKRRLAVALVVQRILSSTSKLATSRSFEHSTLSEELVSSAPMKTTCMPRWITSSSVKVRSRGGWRAGIWAMPR